MISRTDYKFDTRTKRVFVSAKGDDADRFYLMRDHQLPCKFEMKPESRTIIEFNGYLNDSGSEYIIARNFIDDMTIDKYRKLKE